MDPQKETKRRSAAIRSSSLNTLFFEKLLFRFCRNVILVNMYGAKALSLSCIYLVSETVRKIKKSLDFQVNFQPYR